MAMTQPCVSGPSEVKVLTSEEPVKGLTPSEVQEEVRKYTRYLPQVAEPNLARVREIKEEIQKGTYLTREVVEETASRLVLRFLRRE